MPQIKKLFATLFVCLCATNAWAGYCKYQLNLKSEELNNDKYLYLNTSPKDTGSGDPVFVCGGDSSHSCANGAKIFISAGIDAFITHKRKEPEPTKVEGKYGSLVECSDKVLDSKWENKTSLDIQDSLQECSYDQFIQWSYGGLFTNDIQIYCSFVNKDLFGGSYCVSSNSNNEGICWISDKKKEEYLNKKEQQDQQNNAPQKQTSSEPDCGVVGKPECDGEYKYYVCENNSNCNTDHLPPHATAGHCVSAGRIGYKVCTATACEPGFTPTGGWCQLEKKSSDTATDLPCATLTFNDGKECKNIYLAYDYKAGAKFYGEIQSSDITNYFSCKNREPVECKEHLWDLDKINGESVKNLVKGATSIHFQMNYGITIHDCDSTNGYVPDESTKEPFFSSNSEKPDGYTYKRCIKKSSDGGANQGTPPKKTSDPKATEVFTKLDKILDEHFTKSSVWKNDEGKFNTARLASDSIAGVVLGTVGGIVTSQIIKKNQIKTGFQDLKCTIAGQDVADYGDEFRVSVK